MSHTAASALDDGSPTDPTPAIRSDRTAEYAMGGDSHGPPIDTVASDGNPADTNGRGFGIRTDNPLTSTLLDDPSRSRYGKWTDRGMPLAPRRTYGTNQSTVTASTASLSSSGTVQVVVHNFSSGATDRYSMSASEESNPSGSLNTDVEVDDRQWLLEETPHAPWDPEFSATVHLRNGCSGVLVSEFHVLTAAHCIYDNENSAWERPGGVSPAVGHPGAATTHPYGEANVVLARTYDPFVDEPQSNTTTAIRYDMALLTLDRPLGQRAGTANIAYRDVSISDDVYQGHSVDVTGYPGTPRDPTAPTPSLWRDVGNTTGALCSKGLVGTTCYERTVVYDVYTSKGQSGSPVVHNRFGRSGSRYVTDVPVVIAVHSFGNVNDNDEEISGGGPRITPARASHITSWIQNDTTADASDGFEFEATGKPFIAVASERSRVPSQWHDWQTTTPDMEVVSGNRIVYEREVVNIGTATFSGQLETVVVVGGSDVTRRTVQVDSLAPGESVTVRHARTIDQPPGTYKFQFNIGNNPGYETANFARSSDFETLLVRGTPGGWYGDGYNRRNTGYHPLIDGPRGDAAIVDWQTPLNGTVLTSPVLRNGTVYAVTQTGTLRALSARNGTILWNRTLPTDDTEPVNESGLAVGDGQIYVGTDFDATDTGTVYAVDATDGSVEWSADTTGARVEGLTAVDGAVVAATTANLTRFDAADGSIQATISAPAAEDAALTYGSAVVPTHVGSLQAVSSRFTRTWNLSLDDWLAGVTVGNGRVIVRDDDATVYGIDTDQGLTDGRVVWSTNLTAFDPGARFDRNVEPLLVDDYVVVGADDGSLYALSAANGSRYWTASGIAGGAITELVGANGTVYALARNGDVAAIDVDTGSVLWRHDIGAGVTPPVVGKGRLFVVTNGTELTALEDEVYIAPQAAVATNKTTFQLGSTVAFDATYSTDDGYITAYEWRMEAGGTFQADDGTVVYPDDGAFYTEEGTYEVTVRVTDDDGLTDTANLTVEATNDPPEAVVDQYTPPTWLFSFALDESDEPIPLMVRQNLTLEEGSNPPAYGSIQSREWDVDDDGTFEATGPSVTTSYATPDTRQVTLRVTGDDGGVDTATVGVDVQENHPPDAVATLPNRSVVPVIPLNASGSSDPDDFPAVDWMNGDEIESYRWDLDGDGTTEATTPFNDTLHRVRYPGNYSGTLTVVDDAGATASTAVSTTVEGWANATGAFNPGDSTYRNTVVAEDGTAVVSDGVDTVRAYNVTTGRMIWKRTFDALLYETPAASTDRAFVVGNGNVTALDLNTGARLWKRNLGFNGYFSVVEGHLYVGGAGGEAAKLDLDGTVEWDIVVTRDYTLDGGPAIVSNDNVYFPTSDSGVAVLDVTDGSVVRTLSIPGYGPAGVADTADGVVATSQGGGVAAFRDDGTERWSHQLSGSIDGPPTVADGVVHVYGDNVTALDLADGSQVWQRRLTGATRYPGTHRNGTLYVLTGARLGQQAYLRQLDATSGDTTATYFVPHPDPNQEASPDSAPVLSGDHIVFQTIDGTVFAIPDQGTGTAQISCAADVVSGSDDQISLTEIQQAINWWAEDTAVPNTGGQTITLTKIQGLINAWAEDEAVGC